ncbi:MAG: tetratricopeptide repeat protein [Acidobacteriota bacterium]
MSERLSQKQIKQDIREDEVQSFLITAIERFQERPSFYIGIVVAVMLGGAAATGLVAYNGHRQEVASSKLSEVIKVYGAPVVEEGAEPDDAQAPSFASEDAKRSRTESALAEVSGGVAGEIAELYAAQLALESGDAAKARTIWESFLGGNSDHVLAMSVQLNLIRLDRQEEKNDELAQRLQQEVDGTNKTLPEDMLLFELAKTRQALGQDQEALDLFQLILDEYPTSAYAAEARQETTAAG